MDGLIAAGFAGLAWLAALRANKQARIAAEREQVYREALERAALAERFIAVPQMGPAGATISFEFKDPEPGAGAEIRLRATFPGVALLHPEGPSFYRNMTAGAGEITVLLKADHRRASVWVGEAFVSMLPTGSEVRIEAELWRPDGAEPPIPRLVAFRA